MGIRASIYRNPAYAGCSLNGVSERFNEVCVINAEGPFEPTEDCPAVELRAMRINSNHPIHVYAVPVEVGHRHSMHGGSFISTSDSRFSEAVVRLGGVGSVAIGLHDRVER